ncbi:MULTISPECIES: ATP-binding cassette domain-containing protein [unclassified Microbacterium]|uniref:ATP-binding cassette domain-containing protein n=1 Tax=unclassified Microbacterium TaxID=2609290 RepID=UPI003016B8AA
MPEGQVLEFTHVTKRFNEVTAVSDFSARVEPGAVTAFLGPNGAGKTTTLRILLGQVRATSGTATIGGTPFAELRQPLRTIGSVLEETVYRPRRTAERQLTIAAKANGIPLARVGEVLSMVGLDGEGDSRIGGFSLGMRQRLSVAHALLGDPGALVFDEPANGLDPEGIRWMRLLMRRLADEGRTVLVSSHVLSEVEQVADNVLVLSKGKLVLASGIETLADPKGGSVIVDAADRAALTTALAAAGFDIEVLRSGLTVRGGDAGTVGAVAADAGIALSTLVQRGPTLEDVFIDLMRGGRRVPPAEATPAPLAAATPVESPADEASAPVDSAVAIPVAAAAAWAAEAASTPADETVADDLAETVSGDVDAPVADEAVAEEAVADEGSDEAPASADDVTVDESGDEEASNEAPATDDAPASDDAPATDETPVEDASADDATGEATPDTSPTDETEAAPAPSFDEILFGSPLGAAASDETQTDTADADGSDDHPGVEIFSELDAASHADDAAASDEDPRSAAVSSMLAAAAKAYYVDEPKDYPLAGSEASAESSDDGAHWSVASTGVIDTVPLSDAESASGESDSDENDSPETVADEHTEENGTEENGAEENSDEHHDSERHDGGEPHHD